MVLIRQIVVSDYIEDAGSAPDPLSLEPLLGCLLVAEI
jgi:hypothetical protein